MTNFFLIACIFLVSISLYSAEPSSNIPDRREFSLSQQYKPCDDFHKYVCDDVEKSFKLRDDRSRHAFAFNDSAERILEKKKYFFKNIKNEKNLTKRSMQLKNIYSSCMNEKSGQIEEVRLLKKEIATLQKIKTAEQFIDLQIQHLFSGELSIFWTDAGSNQDNPKIADLSMGSNIMNLPDFSYYNNAELMAEYKTLIIDFFKKAEPTLSEIQRLERVNRFLAFEKEFVDIYPHSEILRQRWSEKRQQSQDDFAKKYSNLSFSKIFNKVLKSTVVFNAIPESFDFLNKKVTADNLQTLKDLYLYKFSTAILDDSDQDFFNKQWAFKNKYLGASKTRPDRGERCTRLAMDLFAKELDQILMPRLFPNFPEEKFTTVTSKIKDSILQGINDNTWLSSESKQKALLKIQKMKLYLVKPKNDLEWYFLPVQKFSENNKIENLTINSKNVFNRKILEIKNGKNLSAWYMGPLTVNAYYDASINSFVMPMGILQYPFFNAEGDIIENLGAVGAVVGHEIGHGIDDEGSKFDENGKLNQWMTMRDLKEFSVRGEKLITYFNKAGHNGKLTIGENIGDLVGLTFAYSAAFPNNVGSIEDKKKLFISYARLWCNVALPKAEEQQLKTNPHALGWARINEQVKHQKGFAEAFKCNDSDKMSLPDSERVKIW